MSPRSPGTDPGTDTGTDTETDTGTDTVRELLGHPIPAWEAELLERLLEPALATGGFEAGEAEGARLELDEAVALALTAA